MKASLLLMAAPLLGNLTAQEPSIRTSLDTAVINIGDRINLTVSVEHDPASVVQWPESLSLAPFEILDAVVSPATVADGVATSSATFTLTAFELGDIELPSFEVTVSGTEPETLETDGWLVTVESVGLDESGEIRDVKGPMSVDRNWWLIAPWILAALAALAGIVWWLRKKRGKDDGTATEVIPARPAHETALEALAELETSGLLEKGEFKEFHIRVSDILRSYIEARFSIDALEMVTEEVVDDLHGVADASTTEAVERFLVHCDLVKFAKHIPAPEASRTLITEARRIVQTTMPEPIQEEVAA